MADPTSANPATGSLRAARGDLSRLKQKKLEALAQGVASGEPPPQADIDELDRLNKFEATLKAQAMESRRDFEIRALATLAVLLLVLTFVRLPSTSADIEVHATGVQLTLDNGAATTLVPGESRQILTLKSATISGYEHASPPADGGPIEIDALSSSIPAGLDPSARLQAITLPADAPTAVTVNVAYNGNLRGINLSTSATSPVSASLGKLVVDPGATHGAQPESWIDPVTVQGKALQFGLYPSDQASDLAVFRDVHVSSIAFEQDGHSTILSGEAHLSGRNGAFKLSPSDLLDIKSNKLILLRELTLSKGELKVVLSAPHATELRIGEDAPRNLLPTLFEWLLLQWPAQLYATLSAVAALWLTLRHWWSSAE